jgi:uncharacterized protein (UPF0332 family)
MTPRSDEYLQQARERLSDAQKIVGLVHSAVTVNTAYYAMLNAAQAMLSERGEHAKTHSGIWTLFSATFVATGEFDQALSALARQAKEAREKGDYAADPPSPEEADELVGAAAAFLAAIESMLGSSDSTDEDDDASELST